MENFQLGGGPNWDSPRCIAHTNHAYPIAALISKGQARREASANKTNGLRLGHNFQRDVLPHHERKNQTKKLRLQVKTSWSSYFSFCFMLCYGQFFISKISWTHQNPSTGAFGGRAGTFCPREIGHKAGGPRPKHQGHFEITIFDHSWFWKTHRFSSPLDASLLCCLSEFSAGWIVYLVPTLPGTYDGLRCIGLWYFMGCNRVTVFTYKNRPSTAFHVQPKIPEEGYCLLRSEEHTVRHYVQVVRSSGSLAAAQGSWVSSTSLLWVGGGGIF